MESFLQFIANDLIKIQFLRLYRVSRSGLFLLWHVYDICFEILFKKMMMLFRVEFSVLQESNCKWRENNKQID